MLRMTEEQRPDYVCLSETWACPKSFQTVENYALYQSPAGRAGGVILLVKQALRPKYLTTIVMAGGQAVLATVPGGIIGSVYAPPRATVADLSEFIRKLQSFHGAMILAGDWNARAVEWSDTPSARGDCLKNARRFRIHASLQRSFRSSRGNASNIDLVVAAGRVEIIGLPELMPARNPVQQGHSPILSRLQWRNPSSKIDMRIRPSRLSSPHIQELAAAHYADYLPGIANAMEMVQNESDMDLWYELLTSALREPFLETNQKPNRARPGWSKSLDQLRKYTRKLYAAGYCAQSQTLGRWIQRTFRKRARTRHTQLAKELVAERDPHRAKAIRRALGISPKKISAPELVRMHFGRTICESTRDRLPPPRPEMFDIPIEFVHDIKASIHKAKAGRAPGPDGVYGEMIHIAAPWLSSLLPDLWCLCGKLKLMPTPWRTQATEPAYKSGPTDDPKSYRPIGIVPTLRSVIDRAFRLYTERRYTPHCSQHGFRKGVSPEHAILRVMHSTRTRNAPVGLLDIKGAYPSVPRQELVAMVRERIDPNLANMLTVLLSPTCVIVLGDPTQSVAITQRGLTQGDLKATTLFSLFIDPLLETLDPDACMSEVVAFADDITLTPRNDLHLQTQLDTCMRWGWNSRMTWSTTKSCVVTPHGQALSVRLCAETLPVMSSGKLLGVVISAGRDAQVLPEGTVERIKKTVSSLQCWKREIKLHQRHPNYAWRRAMLHQFIRPIAEYGLSLVPVSPALQAEMIRYDRKAAEFVLGHGTRMPTDRVQAIFRLQGCQLRKQWLATKFGMRTREQLSTASNQQDGQNSWIAERRAKDYRAYRPVVDAVIREVTQGETEQEFWRRMLHEPSNRMSRRIPSTILSKRHGQATLPPMLQNRPETSNSRAAFLAAQYYLNHFPSGLGAARKKLGVEKAEKIFSILKELMGREELTPKDSMMAKDIMNTLYECGKD
jgi:Reverse transcriptase (RNA-dependent DNA polymerase)/Endonuclease-reverse transcriptase